MKHSHNATQTSFLDVGLMEVEIPADNPLMLVHMELDWDAMVTIVGTEYSAVTGRPCKSIRMMLGLEIAKHILRETDESIVERFRTDMALQVFCGFSSLCTDIPHPSTLTYFRKRLKEKTLRMLEEVNLRKFQKKLPRRKRHQVIADSTCMEANVTRPMDSKLLSKAHAFLVNELEKARKNGAKIVIRGKRTVRCVLIRFRKFSKKTEEDVRKLNTFLIAEGRKLLKQLEEQIKRGMHRLNRHGRVCLAAARIALAQQAKMLRTGSRKIKDRILSLHEPMVRAIPRGKEGKKCEFGKKVTFSCIGGVLLQTARVDHRPFSDREMVEDSVAAHERTFGRKPSELSADRGAHSPENHIRLARDNIGDGIQWKGKIPDNTDLPPPAFRKRTSRQRSGIEARIGIWKNRFGGHRNTYRERTAHVKITFSLLGMNALAVAA